MAKRLHDPTGMNTDRYYAARTRSVIKKTHFSERRGRAGDGLPAPKPAMVFRSEDSNANKYYQEGYGQHRRKVAPAVVATKPAPVVVATSAPVVATKPASVVAAKPVVAEKPKAAARPKMVAKETKPKPKETAKPKVAPLPEKPTVDAITLVAGEQLTPVINAVIDRLKGERKVTVTSKSKTLMADFDAMIGEAVESGKTTAMAIATLLVRKLDNKTLPTLAFSFEDGEEAAMPEMTADEMKSVIMADDPEKKIAELAEAETPVPEAEEENYFEDDEDEDEDEDDDMGT